MYIYVLAEDGSPLMPTQRAGAVRRMLRDGLAVIVSYTPFTIRLTYESTTFTQPVTVGVDAGSKTVGVSASTETKELYRSEVTLRNDIIELLSTRREARRARRSRKLRYRKPRFKNRTGAKKEGWLAPSIRQKVECHFRIVQDVCRILPIKNIVVEVAQFDTQLLKNSDIAGEQYQQGPQLGFWNTREYVLFRDNHQCQHCHGKSGNKVLNVHHIESRKTGGDSPDNLITLCETCHKAYHRGEIDLKVKRTSQSLRDAAFMSIVRWEVYNKLKTGHPGKAVRLTFGYLTKHKRIINGIEKTHCADAFCIAGNLGAQRFDGILFGRCVARHSRSLHLAVPKKGGRRRSTVASHWIGKTRFQRYDTVSYNGHKCIISGSTNGRPILRDIDWKQVAESPSVNPKRIQFIQRKKGSILWL